MTFPYWYNGRLYGDQPLAIAVDDSALLYGASVFSTLRVYGQSLDHPLTAWEAHCHRLRQSLRAFNWADPDWVHLQQGAEHLLPHFSVLRLTLLPDGRELITGRPLPADLRQRQQQGITAWVADAAIARSLPHHKTGNYLPCWLALQTAKTHAASEAILVNGQGHWLETSTGTLWGWDGEHWWTPPLASGILPGIARSQLISHLHDQGLSLQEAPWTTAIRRRCHLLAYSNCVVEIIPIHTVLCGETRLEYKPISIVLAMLRSLFRPTD